MDDDSGNCNEDDVWVRSFRDWRTLLYIKKEEDHVEAADGRDEDDDDDEEFVAEEEGNELSADEYVDEDIAFDIEEDEVRDEMVCMNLAWKRGIMFYVNGTACGFSSWSLPMRYTS